MGILCAATANRSRHADPGVARPRAMAALGREKGAERRRPGLRMRVWSQPVRVRYGARRRRVKHVQLQCGQAAADLDGRGRRAVRGAGRGYVDAVRGAVDRGGRGGAGAWVPGRRDRRVVRQRKRGGRGGAGDRGGGRGSDRGRGRLRPGGSPGEGIGLGVEARATAAGAARRRYGQAPLGRSAEAVAGGDRRRDRARGALEPLRRVGCGARAVDEGGGAPVCDDDVLLHEGFRVHADPGAADGDLGDPDAGVLRGGGAGTDGALAAVAEGRGAADAVVSRRGVLGRRAGWRGTGYPGGDAGAEQKGDDEATEVAGRRGRGPARSRRCARRSARAARAAA